MCEGKQLTVEECAVKIFENIVQSQFFWNKVFSLRIKFSKEFENGKESDIGMQVCNNIYSLYMTNSETINIFRFRTIISKILNVKEDQLPLEVEEVFEVLGKKLKEKLQLI